MKTKLIALSGAAVLGMAASANAMMNGNFYAGGSLDHFNNRYSDKGITGISAGLTNSTGLKSLGLTALAGYSHSIKDNAYFATELAISYDFGKVDEIDSIAAKSPFLVDLLFRPGYNVNKNTSLYGVLGVGYKQYKVNDFLFSEGEVSLAGFDVIVGVGMETDVYKNTMLFVQYDYRAPVKKAKDDDKGIDLKNDSQVLKIGARYFFAN